MLDQEHMYRLLKRIKPSFLIPGPTLSRFVTAAWPLPHKRILIAAQERSRVPDTSGTTRYSLHVVNQRERQITPVGMGAPTEYADEPSAIAAAVEWMQGLRAEQLEGCDRNLLAWLGEMAYRMTPAQLSSTEAIALDIPYDAWESPDNPSGEASDRLTQVLAELGFSDDYISEHLG